MNIYEDVRSLGTWLHPEAGFPVLVYYDKESRDWYEVRKEWTKGVIAVWPDQGNAVSSWEPVAVNYVPIPGQTLYEVDSSELPTTDMFELLGYYSYGPDGFAKVEQVVVERTKADIIKDLQALQKELEAMQE